MFPDPTVKKLSLEVFSSSASASAECSVLCLSIMLPLFGYASSRQGGFEFILSADYLFDLFKNWTNNIRVS